MLPVGISFMHVLWNSSTLVTLTYTLFWQRWFSVVSSAEYALFKMFKSKHLFKYYRPVASSMFRYKHIMFHTSSMTVHPSFSVLLGYFEITSFREFLLHNCLTLSSEEDVVYGTHILDFFTVIDIWWLIWCFSYVPFWLTCNYCWLSTCCLWIDRKKSMLSTWMFCYASLQNVYIESCSIICIIHLAEK